MTEIIRRMPALIGDEAIRQGAVKLKTLIFVDAASVPIDMTNWAVFSEIRKQTKGDTDRGPIAATFTIDVSAADQGTFTFKLTKIQTAAIAVGGSYLWDCLFKKPDDDVIDMKPGQVEVIAGVTDPSIVV